MIHFSLSVNTPIIWHHLSTSVRKSKMFDITIPIYLLNIYMHVFWKFCMFVWSCTSIFNAQVNNLLRFATTRCLCGPERHETRVTRRKPWPHHSLALQTERKGLTAWKLYVLIFSCDKIKGWRIVALCFWLSSVIWEQDPVSQPSRQQVLLPVVLLSHYASCGLKVEPAPVNIPQWLWKKQKCRKRKEKHCGEIHASHRNWKKMTHKFNEREFIVKI